MQDYPSLTMQRLLVDAGVTSGMRVLDLGTGRGLVARLARTLVGESGDVLGVDRDLSWVARPGAGDQYENVAYEALDLHDVVSGWQSRWGSFDAIIGRRVLMYLRDPTATLRALASKLVPHGKIVFQEVDFTMVPASTQAMPLHAQTRAWLRTMVEREGANLHMGFHLAPTLTDAGFAVQHVRADAMVECPQVPGDVVPIFRAVLPRLLEYKVVTEAELGLDSLAERLAEERTRSGATFVGDMYFGAWATKL
jgi:SAM-dependent methyltransferase